MTLSCGPALAEGATLSVQISSQRNPDDFADILDAIYKFEGAYAFEDGLFVNGFFEIETPAEGGPDKKNLEGNIGYEHALMDPFSLFASAGVGERFTEDEDFPYYVFRVGGNITVTDWLTWNIVTFRYRDGFKAADDYKTPRLTTKVIFHLDDTNDFYAELYRNYDEDWDVTANAFAVGYSFRF